MPDLRRDPEPAAVASVVHDLTDGIKVSLPEGWVHARASNTESMIRVIVEAEDAAGARRLLDWARDRIRK